MIQSSEHQARVAIDGGSGGIGRAIVARLLSEGAKVCVLDIDAQPWTGRDRSAADRRSMTFLEVDVSRETTLTKRLMQLQAARGESTISLVAPRCFLAGPSWSSGRRNGRRRWTLT